MESSKKTIAATITALLVFAPGCTKWVLREGNDGEQDAAPDSSVDSGLDSDHDEDDPSSDAEPEADLDENREADVELLCPADMVHFGTVSRVIHCIDAYESSCGRPSCEPDQLPQSATGAEPWVEITPSQAEDACARVIVNLPDHGELHKHLCSSDEWQRACDGGDPGREFPYDGDYDLTICSVGGASPRLTGSSTNCEGGRPGLFDMSGNVREWTTNCNEDGCAYLGGSFEDPQIYLGCHDPDSNGDDEPDFRRSTATSIEQVPPYVGFRCCLTIPAE